MNKKPLSGGCKNLPEFQIYFITVQSLYSNGILNFMVSNREQADAVVNSILKNKFAINVVGSAVDFYYLNPSDIKVHSLVYSIQFATKSLLFDEIETSLKKEFPKMDFYTYATPLYI